MSVKAEQLAEHFEGLSDEALLEKSRSGGLTELAQRVADAELRKRGLAGADQSQPVEPEAEPHAADAATEFETVCRTLNVVEAQVLRARLEADGIPVLAADYHQHQTDGLMIIAMGGVRIQVPAEHAARARLLLSQVQSGDLALSDGDESVAPLGTAAAQARRPPLWNPDVAALLSLAGLTGTFGALVHAENWRRLGERTRMWRSIAWAIATAVVFGGILGRSSMRLPTDFFFLMAAMGLNWITLAPWYFADARGQSKYFVEVLRNEYQKADWFIPVWITVMAFGVVLNLVFTGR